MEPLVWYASYGSNLYSERFSCYLAGGYPPGSSPFYAGARDKSPPMGSKALTMPYRLYFTGISIVWGGSPSFIDTVADPSAGTLARAYLITWEQFTDVVAQENGRDSASLAMSGADLVPGQGPTIGPGRYENLLCIEIRDEVPVVTFTAPWSLADIVPSPPSHSYLARLIGGLRESHELTDPEIVGYLGGAPGCSPELVEKAIHVLDKSNEDAFEIPGTPLGANRGRSPVLVGRSPRSSRLRSSSAVSAVIEHRPGGQGLRPR